MQIVSIGVNILTVIVGVIFFVFIVMLIATYIHGIVRGARFDSEDSIDVLVFIGLFVAAVVFLLYGVFIVLGVE